MRRLFRLWRLGARDLKLLWVALRSDDRPRWLLPAALALLFFALEPFNFAVPFLGVVDDLLLLPLLLHVLVKLAMLSMSARRDERVVSIQ
ncbi:MAG TPA: hypothetical protein VGI32_16755 [Steroidobacteraceae bacterium]|jgi:uncharacterized membrane protein YkvA (DUF1232 family)